MLSRLKIGPKLLLAPAAVLLLLIFSSCSSYVAMLNQNRAFEAIVYERAGRMQEAGVLLSEAQQAHANVYQLLTWMSASFSAPRLDTLVGEIRQRHGAIGRRFDVLGRQLIGAGARGSGAERRLLALGRAAFGAYLHDVSDVLELAQQDHSLSANAMSKAERSFDVMERHLAGLSALEQVLSERAQRAAKADFDAAAVLMPAIVALSVMLTGAITMAVRAALLHELGAIGAAAAGLGEGDLSVPRRSYGRDEISETSRALDASIRNLNRTLRDFRTLAAEVDGESRLVAEDNAALAAGAEALPADSMNHQDRQKVRDAALAADVLQRQAEALSRAVADFKLDEAAGPELTLAGGLEEVALAEKPVKGRLHLASVKSKAKR
jgi:methyl-accepting chemotaxis protein